MGSNFAKEGCAGEFTAEAYLAAYHKSQAVECLIPRKWYHSKVEFFEIDRPKFGRVFFTINVMVMS